MALRGSRPRQGGGGGGARRAPPTPEQQNPPPTGIQAAEPPPPTSEEGDPPRGAEGGAAQKEEHPQNTAQVARLEELIKQKPTSAVHKETPQTHSKKSRDRLQQDFRAAISGRGLQPPCTLPAWEQSRYSQEGDVILGGVFLVHSEFNFPELTFKEEPRPIACEGFHVRFYRDVLAMVFAIQEVNQTPDLLPNITLGFQIFDSCMSQLRAIQGVLEVLSGRRDPAPGYICNSRSVPVGLIGEILSSTSAPMARILGLFRFPQISYGSVLSTLSDKRHFPSFLRTVPSSTFQNIALARLMGHFGWTWIGMLISDDDLGLLGGQDMKRVIEEHGGCVPFMEKLHLSHTRKKNLQTVEVAKRHAVKVIIVHSSEVHVKGIMEAFAAQNITGVVFVFSASFTMTLGLFAEQSWRLFNGSLGLVLHFTQMPGFQTFLAHLNPSRDPNDIFIKLFWEKIFHCKWDGLNGTERKTALEKACTVNQTIDSMEVNIFELDDLSSTYHTYLAVYALVHALKSLLSCEPGKGPFINGTCADVSNLQPWQVLHYAKKVNITMRSGGKLKFDVNGDAASAYDILNMQIFGADDIRLVNVGSFDLQQSDEIHVRTHNILLAGSTQIPHSVCSDRCAPGYRKAAREGQPVCCFDCVPCSLGEISVPETDECVPCPHHQWPNEKRDRCIPRVMEFLSFEEPLGLTLAVSAGILSVLTAAVFEVFIKYRDTAIVKANNRSFSYILLVSLTLCFLCSFIFIGRPRKLTCMLRQTVFGIVFTMSVSSVLAKTIMVVIAFKATHPSSSARKWMGYKTPSRIILLCSLVQVLICVVWLVKSPPFPEVRMSLYNEKMFLECNEGEPLFFYCMLGYMGLLATVSFIVAFLSRNLPGSFNEAKLITFSMLVFVSVWIAFIPAYLSTRGKYMVAVEMFAILCSGAGVLGCIYFPKCYVILLRPERNTRNNLIGKHHLGPKKLE